MLIAKMFEEFNKGMKKINSKKWRRERVRCLSCGNEWNCTFLNVRNGEAKLQCPKCKKRNSEIVYDFNR